jgi:hypothetical protein
MLFRSVILSLLLCASMMPKAALAQLEQPSPLPDELSLSAKSELTQMRLKILTSLDALRRQIDVHNQQCGSVPDTDAALVGACEQSQSTLSQKINAYRNELATYEQSLHMAIQTAPALAPPTAAASADGRLQESDNLTIKREIAGIQDALRRLNKSMNLDAAQREEWEQESELATRDAWILAGSATLDLIGAHVDHQIQTADSELKHSVDLLSGTNDPNRRDQLHIAFKVLKDRKDELKRLRSSIDESQESYNGADLANQIVEGRDSKVEVALEAIWKGGEKLKVIPPSASALKTVVDASYLIAVQAASTQRISSLNGNSEQYLAAVKVLKARMEKLVRAQKAQAQMGTGSP